MGSSQITSIVAKHRSSHLKRSTVGVVTLFPNQPNSCKVYLHYCHKGVGVDPFAEINQRFAKIPTRNVKCVIDADNPSLYYVENNSGQTDVRAEELVYMALNINYYHCTDAGVQSVFWGL